MRSPETHPQRSHINLDTFSSPLSSPNSGYSSPVGYPSPAESATLQTPFLPHASSRTEPATKNLPPLPRLFPHSSEEGIQQVHEHHSPFPAIGGLSSYGSPMEGDDFVVAFSDGFSIDTKCSDHNGSPAQRPPSSPPNRSAPFQSEDIGPNFGSDLDAGLHSPQFPSGHKLNPYFIRTYRLEDELGSGGYGFVMTARHRIEGHEVAVKFIIKDKVPEHAWMEDDVIGRLPTEVMLLSFIDHSNIVKCLDLFEDSLYFYLIQELHGSPWPKAERCHPRPMLASESMGSLASSTPTLSPSSSASSLTSSDCGEFPLSDDFDTPPMQTPYKLYHNSDLLHVSIPTSSSSSRPKFTRRPSHDLFECIEQSEHKRLSEDQARHVFSQVVDAVHYLDSQGVTHRDIKDENLVIDKDLNVKLIDFGSAAVVDPIVPRPFYTLFFGTTAYASSEILLKKEYQAPPAEIWTLGVLLSYLLTGTSPFPTVKDAINGRIVLADIPGARLSRAAMGLMRRCLDPNPKTRATIDEVKAHRWLIPKSP